MGSSIYFIIKISSFIQFKNMMGTNLVGHISLPIPFILSKVSLFMFLDNMIQCFKSLLPNKNILNFVISKLIVITI